MTTTSRKTWPDGRPLTLPHRSTITVTWQPTASLGEAAAVRTLIDRTQDQLLAELVAMGVASSTVTVTHHHNEAP